jgi:hypothetical protein
MTEQKTKPTKASVDDFIENVTDEGVRDDCRTLVELMTSVTGAAPTLWGSSIIGFGKYHYKYESGHEGDFLSDRFFSPKTKYHVVCHAWIYGTYGLVEKIR